MKKKIAAALGTLIALALITPSFLPETVRVVSAVEVSTSKEQVFSYLSDLNQFSQWSPFQEMDPEQKVTVEGSGVGSTLTWKSERMGEGIMTLEEADPAAPIKVRMTFLSPLAGEGTSLWTTQSKGDSLTEVSWQFEQKLPYFQRYFGPMMQSGLGEHFQKGMLNLKSKLETTTAEQVH